METLQTLCAELINQWDRAPTPSDFIDTNGYGMIEKIRVALQHLNTTVCTDTPPYELVESWMSEIWHEGTPVRITQSDLHIASRAAEWGARSSGNWLRWQQLVGDLLESIPAVDDRGVLPMIVRETGADDEPELERIICASISGGADYVNNMPRELILERITPEGSTFASYIQADSYTSFGGLPAPAAEGEVKELPPHPLQPLVKDSHGTLRFKANQIVRHLLDTHPTCDLNELACMDFGDDDQQQFAQLIGYSLSGYGELSYVSDANYAAAEASAISPIPQLPVKGEGEEFSDEKLELEFRVWWHERHGSPYFGAVPLVELIEWTKHFADRFGHQPAPPAAGEVGELVRELRDAAFDLNGSDPAKAMLTRAADLLEQRHHEPVPVSESDCRGRRIAMRRGGVGGSCLLNSLRSCVSPPLGASGSTLQGKTTIAAGPTGSLPALCRCRRGGGTMTITIPFWIVALFNYFVVASIAFLTIVGFVVCVWLVVIIKEGGINFWK